jgi:Spy/CpxP family protein refolding chaperone
VRSVAQQETANATEALVEREKIRAEIMDVLTPAQQQSFTQMSDEWRSFVEDRLSHIGDQL